MNMSNVYKDVNIAISPVGNTAFELGCTGIPTIHFTTEKEKLEINFIWKKKIS